MDITHTLHERGGTHGKFEHNAALAQAIKRIIRQSRNYGLFDDVQIEGLEMIAHKIARVCSGDPNFIDNVRDIAGYAQLLVEHLQQKHGSTDCHVSKYTITSGSSSDMI